MKKFILIILLITGFNLPVFSMNDTITVKFKKDYPEKYIKILTLVTGTNIINKKENNFYDLRVDSLKGEVNEYKELFEVLDSVDKVEIKDKFWKKEDLKAGQIIPGELLIKVKQETLKRDLERLNKKFKAKIKTYIPTLNIYQIEFSKDINIDEAIDYYSRNDLVAYAEPNRVMTIQEGGIKVIIPDEKKKIKIMFRRNTEQWAMSLFNIIFNTKILSEKGIDNYIIELPENISVEKALKIFKLSPFVIDIEKL